MCQVVEWNEPQKKVLSKRSRTVYPVTCGACGYTRFLTKQDATHAAARDACKRCHTSAAGKRGYRAACDRGFRRKALAAVAAHQLANPSKPEAIVAAWLLRLVYPETIALARQVIIADRFIIDFVLYDSIAIEVNGGYWHNERRARRDQALRDMWGGVLIEIDAQNVTDSPKQARHALYSQLEGVLSYAQD